MPTFGNGRNNTKTACIFLYRVWFFQHVLGNPALFLAPTLTSGGWFNIKMSSYQHRKCHCGDKTILRPSYLHNGISDTGKMTPLYWIRAQANVISGHAGIPPDGVRLAEKLALVVFRLFPRPLWFHATECCGAVGREPACVASKVCQLADRLAHVRHASLQPKYSCCYRVR